MRSARSRWRSPRRRRRPALHRRRQDRRRGRRYAPQFKPDWSPELLLSYMYMAHAFVVRRTLFDGSVAFARASKVRRTTTSRCARPSARAASCTCRSSSITGARCRARRPRRRAAKPASFDAGGARSTRRSLAAAAAGKPCSRPGRRAPASALRHEFPDEDPRVAILIPTRNHRDVLARCLDSLARPRIATTRWSSSTTRATIRPRATTSPGLPHRVLRVANPGPRFSFRPRQQRRRARSRRRLSAVPQQRHRGRASRAGCRG